MQAETVTQTELKAESPDSNINVTNKKESTTGAQSSGKAGVTQSGTSNGQFPPPKTDKPRPHVCGTCGRSFARLEHLKRHERSHTKEKPFECPECTRCFARRDLLLRHQQKLHMTNTTSSRPRSGRRESVSSAGVSGARVRKNSVANGSVGGSSAVSAGTHRPRANTIGHIDLSGLGFMDTHPGFARMNALGINNYMGMGGLPGPTNFDYRGMSHSIGNHGLPKLDTHAINSMDVTNSLRTAPPNTSFAGFDVDALFGNGTTVNPAQLHFGGSMSATQPNFPSLEPFNVHAAIEPQAQMDDFGWMRKWNMQMSQDNNEQVIDESSPSRLSSGDSPGGYESLSNSTGALPIQNSLPWQHHGHRQSMSGPAFQLEALGSGLPSLDPPLDTISPETLHDPTPTNNAYLHQAMILQQQQQQQQHQQMLQQHSPADILQSQQQNFFAPVLSGFNSDSPSMSSSSLTGSARQSSVTSMSTESITDATRQALMLSLSQPSVFGHNHRKYSQPSISSPLSPVRSSSMQGPSLPSTADIRKYVDAFIQYAHPHLPFLHIPTLSFESEYSSAGRSSAPHNGSSQNGLVGGAGCFILGMAAIGALYEYDHPASKDLFDAAKKMISLYLEERRKADMSAAVNGASPSSEGPQHTPLWLVQAMLLNVIYGHQCGDKTSADIASNHCAALVSLARAADLAQPRFGHSPQAAASPYNHITTNDVDMDGSNIVPGDSISRHQSAESDLQSQWLAWKAAEERKRTLFAIFVLSSLLTTAYNHTPTIMNSEILLDLPCEELLWSAENAHDWQSAGGLAAAELNAVSFSGALSTLLTASQRRTSNHSSTTYSNGNPLGTLQAADRFGESELRPSTFGCLVLINALHNYIWETRSRHHGRQWTQQETESMFSHIEPALNAWQAAWKANDQHKVDRPNPFASGPLSADSIPLLDLAFVRLFVNLGRSKEAFWHRDFDTMAEELARGTEIVQHAEPTLSLGSTQPSAVGATDGFDRSSNGADQISQAEQASSRRERHLRKAAFYAADSLTMACRYNLTYTDIAAHELPIQSAMCFFDCSQVLAEWACTVQERVGGFLGVLGRDPTDFQEVPAIMLLEGDDTDLLRKIDQICENLEAKRFEQDSLLTMDMHNMNSAAALHSAQSNANLAACGYGSKLLRTTAWMLEKAVVWPVTHVMAKALKTQAAQMDQRAEASALPPST